MNLQKKGTQCATRMRSTNLVCVCDVSWRASQSVRGNLPLSRLLFLRRTRSSCSVDLPPYITWRPPSDPPGHHPDSIVVTPSVFLELRRPPFHTASQLPQCGSPRGEPQSTGVWVREHRGERGRAPRGERGRAPRGERESTAGREREHRGERERESEREHRGESERERERAPQGRARNTRRVSGMDR